MATGRIGTTPVLTTRWSKAPANGTTSLSGLDDNSVSLVYSVGYEQVYRNGVLLSRGNDYTATNGTSITLTDATVTGDIIEVFANATVALTDTYTQTQANGKFINNTLTTTTGDIIYASAANTPARLGIGSTGQVLTVSGGVPAWAATGANWSLLNTGGTALTGSQTITVSGISGADKIMILVMDASSASADSQISIRINGDTGSNYGSAYAGFTFGSAFTTGSLYNGSGTTGTSILFGKMSGSATSAISGYAMITGCNASGLKMVEYAAAGNAAGNNGHEGNIGGGFYNSSSTISSVAVRSGTGNFDAGTIYVYTSA